MSPSTHVVFTHHSSRLTEFLWWWRSRIIWRIPTYDCCTRKKESLNWIKTHYYRQFIFRNTFWQADFFECKIVIMDLNRTLSLAAYVLFEHQGNSVFSIWSDHVILWKSPNKWQKIRGQHISWILNDKTFRKWKSSSIKNWHCHV